MKSLVLAGLSLALAGVALADPQPLATVPHVDLSRYLGRWYEIARYPMYFERDCASDATATYTQRDDGKIEVLNACRNAEGKIKSSKGSAKVVDASTNAKLKVQFFWPFSGDYWIIDLAPDYSYAVVGEPDRKYLWILSRTPHLSGEVYEKIIQRVRELGYDPAKLQKTPQKSGTA